MKAVVLEITEKEATVMTHDGDIIGVRNRDYEIGQEITLKKDPATLSARIYKIVPMAITVAATVLLLAGVRLYYIPYGTVSLDINPSIEYTINRFDRVLTVKGVNDDGSDILSGLDTDSLINKNIEDALDTTIDRIEADGYISDEDENYVVVSANTRADDHTDRLLEKLDKKVNMHNNMEAMSFKITDDELSEAHKEGISGGKKKMVDTLEDTSGISIDRNEWKNKSVREIVRECDRIKAEPRGDKVIEPEHTEPYEEHEQYVQPEIPEDEKQREKPEPPSVNEQPETQNIPDVTGQPDRHGYSEDSGPSDQPELPEQKGMSEQPEISEQKGMQENPELPDRTDRADQPEIPEQKGMSEPPVSPEQSDRPEQFVSPEQTNGPQASGNEPPRDNDAQRR